MKGKRAQMDYGMHCLLFMGFEDAEVLMAVRINYLAKTEQICRKKSFECGTAIAQSNFSEKRVPDGESCVIIFLKFINCMYISR